MARQCYQDTLQQIAVLSGKHQSPDRELEALGIWTLNSFPERKHIKNKPFIITPHCLRIKLLCRAQLGQNSIYLYSSVAKRKARTPGISATTKATNTWVSEIDIF